MLECWNVGMLWSVFEEWSKRASKMFKPCSQKMVKHSQSSLRDLLGPKLWDDSKVTPNMSYFFRKQLVEFAA